MGPKKIDPRELMQESKARQILASAADDRFAAVMMTVLKYHRQQGGWATISYMSDLMEMSVRSFQRRLADQGLVYSELVETARQELANELMADQSRTLAEIANQLGYSKVSNFSRAFQRWTGQSPTEYRRER